MTVVKNAAMVSILIIASMVALSVASGTICSNSSNTIQTEPVLTKNTLARNFIGLKLSIKFLLIHDSYWSHPGFTPSESSIYTAFVPCANRNEKDFRVTCQQVSCEGSTYIISFLTLMFPIDRDVTVAVNQLGETNQPLASFDVKVKDCGIDPRRPLEVVSQSSDYNSVGEFRCLKNGVLFYSNRTRVVSNKTKCLATAQWENSDVVQCWTTPINVSVAGSLAATESNNITVKCKHASSFPASNGSLFFFNGTTTYIEEGGTFTITNVQKAYQNQSISCQVQSSYVKLVNQSSGRSLQRFINVLYPPYATSLQKCTWEVNATGICYISFQSNPTAQFISVLLNGTNITHLNDSNNLAELSTTQEHFTFVREKVNMSFTGFYELVLYSNGFGETKISFQINVVDQLPSTQLPAAFPPTQSLASHHFTFIGLSIGILFSVILSY